MNGLIPPFIEWIGIAVFALSGALTAAKKSMDPFGFTLLATVTGIGGGTLRDILLGLPVFWVRDPTDLLICIAIGIAIYGLGMIFAGLVPLLERQNILLWADAIGIAIFAVSGCGKALNAYAHPFAALVLGTLAASFGGIIRDILSGDVPLLLHREVYVTAAFLSAAVFLAMLTFAMPTAWAAGVGISCGFTLRALAILRNWSLPAFRH